MGCGKPQKLQQQPPIEQSIAETVRNFGNDYTKMVVPIIRGQNDGRWVKITKRQYFYQGEWKNGYPHGIGKLLNVRYQEMIIGGFFQSNLIGDKCIKIYADGSLYKGQLNTNFQMDGRGYRQGKGKQFIYQGEFFNDKYHGLGKYIVNDTIFEGQFFENKKKYGKQYNQKYEYIGSFVNDLKHGRGILKWKDGGGRYEGQFEFDMKNGFGKLYDADGSLVRVGRWKHNQMIK